MSEETDEQATRVYYSEIMSQLMASPRFLDWFRCNFDVHKMINEEEKTIDIRVLEVHPAFVEERMLELMKEKVQEDETSPIVTASAADLKALERMGKS